MEENSNTPDVEAVVAPAAEVAPTSGSEAVINTEDQPKQTVPYERFTEVNSGLKETRAMLEATKAELDAIKQNPASLFGAQQPQEEDLGIDPDVQKTLDAYIAKKGFISRSELQVQNQVQSDLAELKGKYGLDDTQVEAARSQAASMGATNKQGLEAAYLLLNRDSMIENAVKAALATAGQPGAVAEKPGPGGATAPAAEERKAGDSKANILAALRRHTS